MKLSELVAFRSALEQYDFHTESRMFVKKVLEAKADIDHIRDKPINQQIRFSQGVYQDELPHDLENLERSIGQLAENFEYYKEQIKQQITDLEETYIKESQRMYISQDLPSTIEEISNRTLDMNDAFDEFLDRVRQLSDWRFPGMIVRPQEKSIVETMASSDPLYLVDTNIVLLEPRLDELNPIYRHRVRAYGISKYVPGGTQFNIFPQEQFGLVVIWNTLNNMSLPICEQTLSQIFGLLRPGGTCLFTFNDCDNFYNVRNFENRYRQFTPGKRLVSLIETLGFLVRHRSKGVYGWMEIRKPGELSTIKGGQSLAKVIRADDATVRTKKQYTQEQIEQIHREAVALGIDSEEKIRGGAIGPGKLELLINRRKHAMVQERELARQAEKEQQHLKEQARIRLEKEKGPNMWSAGNQGYAKGDLVEHGKKIWVANKNIEAKQRFDEQEWSLVE